MKISVLDKLINGGLNYLNFYDSVKFSSDATLLDMVKSQELLERLHNSMTKAILSVSDEDPIFERIRSAAFFLKDASDNFDKSTETNISFKDMTISDVRDSLLESILAYEQYIIYMGMYNLLGVEEDGTIRNISKDNLREAFPDASDDELENTAELFVDYIEELEDMDLTEDVMNIDYSKTGRSMPEYVGLDDEDEDEDASESLTWE